MSGMMQLQRKVKIEKFFGGVNHKQNKEERELGVSNAELTARQLGDHRREPIVVTEVPQEFINELETSGTSCTSCTSGTSETSNNQEDKA